MEESAPIERTVSSPDTPVVTHAARQEPGPVFFPKPLDLDALLAAVEDLTGDRRNGGGERTR